MRKFILFVILCLLVVWPVTVVQAAPPPDRPTGLERALEVKKLHENALFKVNGVAGAAVGYNEFGRPSVIVFAEKPGVSGLPAMLEDVPVIVRVSGKFVALPKPSKPGKPPTGPTIDPTVRFDRPVPIGVSTGHPDITAGTIGARVTDGAKVYALSNNHVYANENSANNGDIVIQPGTYDGGIRPDVETGLTPDKIGTLFDFEPINFSPGADNTIDAAIALTTTDLLGNSTPANGYGVPKSVTAPAAIKMKVKKYGRTTGLTTGQVYAINATVNVGYDTGVARFVNQIIIGPGTFSAGGDSGSLIVTAGTRKDPSEYDRKPVGLLFAGSSSYTIANPIDAVLDRFGVTIDGE